MSIYYFFLCTRWKPLSWEYISIYLKQKRGLFCSHVHFHWKLLLFLRPDINKSSSCARLIKKLCHRSSVSCSIIIVVYVFSHSAIVFHLFSSYACVFPLFLSPERENMPYIYIERDLFAQMNISRYEKRREKSQEGIIEENERQRNHSLCCYICIASSAKNQSKLNHYSCRPYNNRQ